MKSIPCFLALFAIGGCTRPNVMPGGGAPPEENGGITTDGGAPPEPGDMETVAPPLPMLSSASYVATSMGLLANSCTVPPDDDLGTWSLTVVNPSVWNVTLAKGLAPAVLTRAGKMFAGQVAETGMPIFGCTMRETYKLSLTPTSTSQAQGRLDTIFDALAGDCSMYEPVLPCTQSYAVRLNAQ